MTELDEKALAAAKRAYDAKYADMSSPYPTEEPDAGGGPLGYAIMAYLDAIEDEPGPVHGISSGDIGGINHSARPGWKIRT